MNRMFSMYCDHVTCSAGHKRRKRTSWTGPALCLLAVLVLAALGAK